MSYSQVFTSGVLWMALMPVLWSSSAFPGEYRCPENMSCISDTVPMSLVVADSPKMSVAASAGTLTLSACEQGFHSRRIEATIKICEAYLAGNTGTVRDRATAMHVLGHAYSRSRKASANRGKAGEGKVFALWSRAAELDPTYIEPHLSLANMFALSDQNDQAQAAFDRAEAIDPKDWRIFTGRANAYFSMRTVATVGNALKAAEKAASIKPDEPIVRMVYGRMLQTNGKYEDAAREYEAAVGKYDPAKDTSLDLMREPNPLQSLAYVYGKMGKPALAAETLNRHMDSLSPAARDYTLYEERAGYYELAGLLAKAAADFKEASLRAPPEHAADLTAKQAMLLAKAGAKSEAGEELRSVLARGNLKSTLKVQVFLRNQGYTEVTINGRYDEPTKRALNACLLDKACAPGVGQAI